MSDVAPDQRPQQGGVAAFLSIGLAAALGGCAFAWYHTSNGATAAESLGFELSGLARLYLSASLGAFAVPVVTWLIGMAITRGGRRQRNLGLMLAVFLFGFAVLWPAGAIVAFMPVYNRELADVRGS
ncbi:MAG: hypothetical protein H6840_08385 [Planctomycetes bacterium]|nr:hypothetical protein [Planctomycetota bacterium]